MLHLSGYKLAGGNMVRLTPIQTQLIALCQTLAMGGQTPRPDISVEEYEKSLSGKCTVKEFITAMKRKQELTKKLSTERDGLAC
jgi:uncharacterized protein YbbK (DUF523 family)